MTDDTLTLAIWQSAHAPTVGEALQRLDEAAAAARAQGAHGLICPEMSLTGYALGAARMAALAEPADGPMRQAVSRLARRHGLAIVYGYPERLDDGGPPCNAVQALGPDGTTLAHYRKTHLYGPLDRAQFRAGERASEVFVWRGWRLGLLICYDVEFPEAVRLLALQGADAVLVPTANMMGFDEVPRVLVPARACENRLYVAYANACGHEGEVNYAGLSTVAGPGGQVLMRAGRGPALRRVQLSRLALERAARQAPWADRRVDLYGPLQAPINAP